VGKREEKRKKGQKVWEKNTPPPPNKFLLMALITYGPPTTNEFIHQRQELKWINTRSSTYPSLET